MEDPGNHTHTSTDGRSLLQRDRTTRHNLKTRSRTVSTVTHHTVPGQPGPAPPREPAEPPSCLEASNSTSSSASCVRETQNEEIPHRRQRSGSAFSSNPVGEPEVLSDSAPLLAPTQVILGGRSSGDSCRCERSPHPPPPWSPGGGSTGRGHTAAPTAGGDTER